MKRILTLSLVFISYLGHTQTVNIPSGTWGTSTNSYMGIGTNAPSEDLTISNNGNVYLGIVKPAYSNKLKFGISGHNGTLDYTAGDAANSLLHFKTNNVTQFTIDEIGYIGIGTTNPSKLLHVNSDTEDAIIHIQSEGSNYSAINFSRQRLTGHNVTGASIYMKSDATNNDATLSIDVNTSTGAGNADGPHLDFIRRSSYPSNFINFTNANVGIGTNSPDRKLEVSGNAPIIRLEHTSDGTSSYGWLEFNDVNSRMGYVGFGSSSNNTLFLNNETGGYVTIPNGNVGIGTQTPVKKLEIYASQPVVRLRHTNDGTSAYGYLEFYDVNSRMGYVGFGSSGNNNLYLNNEAAGNIIVPSGNMGIGTFNPDAKLTVAGNINSREVKVTVDAGADFVFEDDYELRSLEETEQFITKNNHLPEIASADEMVENGLEVGEMNIKLLQKVEELTLYMIEMNKEIKQLKEENSELRKKIEQ